MKYSVNLTENGALCGQDFFFDNFPNLDDLLFVCKEMKVNATDFVNLDDYREEEIRVATIGHHRRILLIQRMCEEEPSPVELLR